VAVTNPLHLLDDRAAMLQRLGPERSAAGRAFAFRTLQQVRRPLILCRRSALRYDLTEDNDKVPVYCCSG